MAEGNYWQRVAASRANRRRALGVGAAGLSAAFLAACGSSNNKKAANNVTSASSGSVAIGSPAASGGGAGRTATPGAGAAAAATPKVPAKPVYGGEAVLRRGSNLTFGNPLKASSGYDVVFNRLYAAPMLDFDNNGNIFPYLLQSFEQTDPQTITLKLRPNLNFTDGTPVNSQAVQYSLKLAMSPDLASPMRTLLAPIASIDTPDPLTAVIKLQQPSAVFLPTLASVSPGGAGALISPTAHDKLGEDKFSDAPVSVGQYAVQEFTHGSQEVFVKNPNFPIKDANGNPTPYLDKITVKVIPEGAVAVASLQSGEIDADQQPSFQDIAAIKANPALDYLVLKGTGLNAISMITNKAPTDNANLRKAICYGVNRDEFAQAFTAGLGSAATTPITQLSWAYDQSVPSYSYDPQKAAQYLAQAGLPSDFSTKILTYADGDWPKMGELAQSQLAKIKLNLQVESVEVPVYTDQFRVKGNYQVAVEGMSAPTGDPWSFMQQRFTTNGNYNPGHPNSPDFDALVAKAATTFDQNERKAIYSQIQKLEFDLADRAWLYYPPSLVTFRKALLNVQWALGIPDFLYVYKQKS